MSVFACGCLISLLNALASLIALEASASINAQSEWLPDQVCMSMSGNLQELKAKRL